MVRILFLLATALSVEAALVNRWTFNGAAGAVTSGAVYADAIAGAPAVVVGTGALATTSAVTIPGTTTGNVPNASIAAYFDLPNGLLSTKSNLTIELWATVVSTKNWQRILDFGRMNIAGLGTGAAAGEVTPDAVPASGTTSSSDDFMLAVNRGTTANAQRLAMRLDGATELSQDSSVTIQTNTGPHHFALQFVANPTGGVVRWYFNGALAATRPVNFGLAAIEDVNNWLGRSQFSGDSQANIRYEEMRVHDSVLTTNDLLASLAAGPNPATHVPQADAVTMHHQQKARIGVLTNDTGTALPGTVAVTQAPLWGSAVPDAAGRILYTHTNGLPAGDSFVYSVTGLGTNVSRSATVTVAFASALRIAATNVNLPAAPPGNAVQFVQAFGGTSFNQPVCLASPPGDTQRVFVCEKGGLLRVVTNLASGAGGAPTFLNLPAVLTARGESISTQSEQGLLGLAFHPGYATNRHFYLFYSVTSTGLVYERVARFTTRADNPNLADTNSQLILISQYDEAGNHNGGDLHFDTNGWLFVTLGDEGNQNDSFNNSQRIDKDFFSGILRLDVDKRPGSLAPNHHPSIVAPTNYAIPPDNPFVGATNFIGSTVTAATVRTEFWAVGLRNPWRIAFDPLTGELWCGDVGGGSREEVDIIVPGANYGWAFREGFIAGPKSGSAPANFTNLYHTPPIHDYAHGSGTNQGNSITGGRVYRGARFPSLYGRYIFGDYSSGNIWSLLRNGTNAPIVERLGGQGGTVAFGVDPSNDDLLLADITAGRIFRLELQTPDTSFPTTLDATRLFADLTDLSPAPGVLPYEINLPFWSDHGIKRRWFGANSTTSLVTWTREGPWGAPPGMFWVKHFDLDLNRTNPATRTRIETRVLVRTTNGAYGVSYRWNTNATDATLVEDGGSNFVLQVVENGVTRPQNWRIPSRTECLVCHTPQAGHALSFTTRQWNRTNTIANLTGNQIALLQDGGCFANAPESPNLLPRHLRPGETQYPLEARVRSYLEVNCAYCHKAGGSAPSGWDGRTELTLDQTGLINGTAVNNGGDPLNKLVVPGDTLHSIVLNRMAASNGFTRMPPLGSAEIDATNVALVTEWILSALPARQTYNDWRFAQFGSTNSPDGAPGFDYDGDGHSNQQEYLFGSNPLAATNVPFLGVEPAGSNVAVRFGAPANRSVQVEASTNLQALWQSWDVPGNNALPHPGGTGEVQGVQGGAEQYFRLRIREN